MALRGVLGSGLGAPWSRVTPRHFAWQAWHNLTSTFVSRGRRGIILHPPSFRVPGVALIALRGSLGSGLGAPWSRVTPRHFAWQAWHNLTSTFVSRGRRGTISHPPSLRVAGVALMALCGILRGRRGTTLHPRGRRGTHGTPWRARVWFGRALVARDAAAFYVAGVAQTYIHLRFTWQACYNLTSTFVSRGRRGTHGTPWRAWVWFGRALVARDAAAFCVAGVAQPYIHLRLTWQAWHNLTSTFVSRGRRGTHGTPRHFAWQVWHNVTSAWQAWHSWHSVACLGLVWARSGRA